MANVYKQLYQGAPAAGASTALYDPDTAKQAIVKRIHAVNTSTTTSQTVKFSLGGSTDADTIIGPITLAPGYTMIDTPNLTLEAALALYATIGAGSATVTVTLWGLEMDV